MKTRMRLRDCDGHRRTNLDTLQITAETPRRQGITRFYTPTNRWLLWKGSPETWHIIGATLVAVRSLNASWSRRLDAEATPNALRTPVAYCVSVAVSTATRSPVLGSARQ
jgi:hypothetical protein